MQMTDAQVMTLGLSFALPLSMLLYSNSRVTDARDSLRNEMTALRNEMVAEMKLLRSEMNAGFERIETALRIHELEHHK